MEAPPTVLLPEIAYDITSNLVVFTLPPFTALSTSRPDFFHLLGFTTEVPSFTLKGKVHTGFSNFTERSVNFKATMTTHKDIKLDRSPPEGNPMLYNEVVEAKRKQLITGNMKSGIFPFTVWSSTSKDPRRVTKEVEVAYPITSLEEAGANITKLVKSLLGDLRLPETLIRCDVAPGRGELHLYIDRGAVPAESPERQLTVTLTPDAAALSYLTLGEGSELKARLEETAGEAVRADRKVSLLISKPEITESGNSLVQYQPYAVTMEGDGLVHNVVAYVESDGNIHGWAKEFNPDHSVVRLMFKGPDFESLTFHTDMVVQAVFRVE